MGKLLFKGKACVSVYWALMVMYSAAELQYFPSQGNLSWVEARKHCQACYKDLVTLTPENIQTITQKLTFDSWVGLRNSADNSSKPWTRWANGDPLTFQNWYPGRPVLKSTLPNRDYTCTCSCSYPATPTPSTFTEFTTPNTTSFSEPSGNTSQNWTYMNSYTSVTDQGVTGATGLGESSNPSTTDALTNRLPSVCEASCVPDVPDINESYIEDSCVVILSFGTWIERNCSDLLPFICYEDRFFGQANVTNVTSSSANITWLQGPGNISHYRLEVKGDQDRTKNLTDLTAILVGLTAGTHYSVQVFPVKCERDLNPQEVAFYTIPYKVENLTVTGLTEDSISLNWSRPAGNVDFYVIEVQDRKQNQISTEEVVISGLTPGSLYKFTVLSGVGIPPSNATFSEESSITAYTKPGKVSNLSVSENTEHSLLLTWQKPIGLNTGYSVTAVNDSNAILFTKWVNQTNLTVTGLPKGTQITLNVTALANGTLEGDKVTVVSFTAPDPVSNLILVTTHNTLKATWSSPVGCCSHFIIELELNGVNVPNSLNETQGTEVNFESLKSAANYTVIVYSVKGHLRGSPVKSSNFTLALPPTDASISSFDKQQMTLQWKAPANSAANSYSVKISSSFWNYSWSLTVTDKTNHTFSGLISGTKYEFEVQTVADTVVSVPAYTSQFTDAEEREVSLSMLCSSAEFLLCDKKTTRESVFSQLHAHFNSQLGDGIFWRLEAQETENQGTQ